MHLIARLKLELAYYDSAIQCFDHYTTWTFPGVFKCAKFIETDVMFTKTEINNEKLVNVSSKESHSDATDSKQRVFFFIGWSSSEIPPIVHSEDPSWYFVQYHQPSVKSVNQVPWLAWDHILPDLFNSIVVFVCYQACLQLSVAIFFVVVTSCILFESFLLVVFAAMIRSVSVFLFG